MYPYSAFSCSIHQENLRGTSDPIENVRCVPATHCLASCRGQVAHNSNAPDIGVSTTSIEGSSILVLSIPSNPSTYPNNIKKHGKLPAPGSFGIVIQDMPLLPHPSIHPDQQSRWVCRVDMFRIVRSTCCQPWGSSVSCGKACE